MEFNEIYRRVIKSKKCSEGKCTWTGKSGAAFFYATATPLLTRQVIYNVKRQCAVPFGWFRGIGLGRKLAAELTGLVVCQGRQNLRRVGIQNQPVALI